MTARSASTIHREVVLQDHLLACLVAEQGYEARPAEAFDRELALDRELLLRFLQATQAEEWQKLEAGYGTSA